METIRDRLDYKLSKFFARDQRILHANKPVVSFTFDDIPESALRAADLLEEAGARGTFYIASAMIGTTDNTLGRYADKQQICDLASRGHELGCHTYSHARAASYSQADFGAELDRNRKVLADLTGVEPKSFAFPFGSVSIQTKYTARARYSSCRTTRPFFQTNVFDACGLGAFAIYSHSDHLSVCEAMIEKAAKRNGWLIYYTHDISDTPSPYGCSEDQLLHLISYCKDLGCAFSTVADVIEKHSVPRNKL